MLTGKTIILGVSGSIAAYKSAYLASLLIKANADVHVIMTDNATNFINPITFETLTNNKCLVDTFDRNFQYNVEHVSLAKKADLFILAPASANVIAKMAHGLADDMLTTTALACRCKKLISPAMNTNMYQNPITQKNLSILSEFGMEIISPATGYLACGDVGEGKMPDETVLFDYVMKSIAYEKDLSGKRILITAGPTQESIDPVRYITNHSSGKMGYSLAKMAMLRGASVILITGETNIAIPPFVDVVKIKSADEMFEAVKEKYKTADIIIKAAAVADYTPISVADEKIKKKDGDMKIELKRTVDILSYLGNNRYNNQYICGFSMETENMIENSRKKLINKNVDMMCANNVKVDGAGFGVDTNILTIITKDKEISLEKMSKDMAANEVLNNILSDMMCYPV